jgi:hypothetical protein
VISITPAAGVALGAGYDPPYGLERAGHPPRCTRFRAGAGAWRRDGLRALRGPRRDRRWLDGPRFPGLRSPVRATRRHQDHQVRVPHPRHPRRVPPSLPPRGAGRGPALQPQHRDRLRLRRGLSGDGARPRGHPEDPPRAAEAGGGRGPGPPLPPCRGPRLRPPGGDRPPGPEARQHHDPARRKPEADGLRDRAPRHLAHHRPRSSPGVPGLHGPRDASGRGGHVPGRPLFIRHRGLRGLHQPQAVRGGQRQRGALQGRPRAAAVAPDLATGASGSLRWRLRAGAGEGAGAPLPDRPGVRRRPPGPRGRRDGFPVRAGGARTLPRHRDPSPGGGANPRPPVVLVPGGDGDGARGGGGCTAATAEERRCARGGRVGNPADRNHPARSHRVAGRTRRRTLTRGVEESAPGAATASHPRGRLRAGGGAPGAGRGSDRSSIEVRAVADGGATRGPFRAGRPRSSGRSSTPGDTRCGWDVRVSSLRRAGSRQRPASPCSWPYASNLLHRSP